MSEILESVILTPDVYKEELRKFYQPPTKAAGNLSLQQFFDLMFWTLDVEKPGLVFAPAYPKYLIPSTPDYKKTMENPTTMWADTITYSVTREEPGSQGGSKQPFDNTRREVTPRVREEERKPNSSQTRIHFGQWFDTLVQFDIWALTNFEAERLILWFKRFMMVHRDFLKHMGLSEILFWWRGRDATAMSLNNNLHLRTIVYYVRTEELSYEDDYNLKELKIRLQNIPK